jgi:hypothetical protein
MLCSGFHFAKKAQGWMTLGLFIAAGRWAAVLHRVGLGHRL